METITDAPFSSPRHVEKSKCRGGRADVMGIQIGSRSKKIRNTAANTASELMEKRVTGQNIDISLTMSKPAQNKGQKAPLRLMLLHMYKSPVEPPVGVTFSAAQESTKHRGRLHWPSASTVLRTGALHWLKGAKSSASSKIQSFDKYHPRNPFPHRVVDRS